VRQGREEEKILCCSQNRRKNFVINIQKKDKTEILIDKYYIFNYTYFVIKNKFEDKNKDIGKVFWK